MTEPLAPDTAQLLRDIATHLHNEGLVRWNPDGQPYTGNSDRPALFFERLPDKPDHAIAVAAYNDDRTRDRDTPDFYIQLRGRTPGQDPFTTHRLMDRIFQAIDDSSHILWGTTKVLLCQRTIRGPLLSDSNNRYSRPDSYTITVNPS